jgi:tetratricopeptide (TPR) repeat protein
VRLRPAVAAARRLAAGALLTAALSLFGCGPARVAPPAPVAPKYPEFVFPAAPATVAAPGAIDRQQAGWNFLQAGDTRAAEKEFNAALKQSPGFYPAEAALGYAALARKDASAAIGHFEKALSQNGAYAPALAGKGDALLSQNHLDLALRAFEDALSADPTLQALRARVDVLKFRTAQQDIASARKAADEGHFDEARKLYQEAIAASPQSAFLYRELAAVDQKSGDATSALAHAERAGTLDPSDARTQVLIGQIYESQRQWAKAADAYAAANALEPSEALNTKIEELRERGAFDSMPDE